MTAVIYTIGHSTLPLEQFLGLLQAAGITAIADIRTSPYSRFTPHFNRDALQESLKQVGIAYVFLGQELGGRPKEKAFYCDGIADYEKMAKAAAFQKGLERVLSGTERHRIALMCSEQDPLDCHRCLLVGRSLFHRHVEVEHILPDGQKRSQVAIEADLLAQSNLAEDDLFASADERLARAYRNRAMKVAYSDDDLAAPAAE